MEPEVQHLALGTIIGACLVTLSWFIGWRRYSRFFAWIFPTTWNTTRQRPIRYFFAIFFLVTVAAAIDAVVMLRPSVVDIGWSLLYGAGIAAIYFAIDGILRWLKPD
jgi:hypothetical protein